MATFLVTGGAGFIGSNIVDALVRNKDKVRVLDNFCSGRRENLTGVMGKIELIEGDIRDMTVVNKAAKGVDYILHQAALRSVPKSLDDPFSYNEVNINGTLNVLYAAKGAQVKRVVFASSSSVYGNTERLPQKESFYPLLISPYAATKLAGEFYCRIFNQTWGLETVALRYFNVYGPRQSADDEYAVVIPKFIACMLKNHPPPVHGDGKQTRDFTYVQNVIDANLAAAAAGRVSGEVFNIACGRAHSVLDIVKIVNKILKKKIKPEFAPPRKGDVRDTLADVSKAGRFMRYKAGVDFEEGLKRTIEWFKNNPNNKGEA